MKTVLTYGTFDIFHVGHVNLLERAKKLGDKLIVGVSTDEFNLLKGKKSLFPYEDRELIVRSLKCVDLVIPEYNWEQKINDIVKFNVDIFVMGSDWDGKFDHLKKYCHVASIERTENISSTQLKRSLSAWNDEMIDKMHEGLDAIQQVMTKSPAHPRLNYPQN